MSRLFHPFPCKPKAMLHIHCVFYTHPCERVWKCLATKNTSLYRENWAAVLMSLPGNGVCQQFLSHSMKRWAASPSISLQTCATQFTCNKAETAVISVKWLRILLAEMPLWKFHPIVTTVRAKERTPYLHFSFYLSDLVFLLWVTLQYFRF